jgi:hypothetical protein
MQKCNTNTGCTFTVPSNCVIYTGSYLPHYGILPNTTLTEILKKIDAGKVDVSGDVETNNTNTLQLLGVGSNASPLLGNVLISSNPSNNIIVVPGQGLYSQKQSLQDTTTVGNTTNNAILVNGQNNLYSNQSGLQLFYNPTGYAVIESKDNSSLNRLDIRSNITNFYSSIVGVTEDQSDNSDKMASTAWVKLQNYISTESDPVAQSRTISLTEGTGISIFGTTQTIGNNPQFTIAANNDFPIWNAAKLQNISVSNATPLSGQVLVYNGSQWIPGDGSGSGSVTSVAVTSSDITVGGSPITGNGTITLTLPNIVTAGVYNNVTVNSKGQVTAGSFEDYLTSETDPTVPTIVKNITQDDIDNWNNAFDKFTTGVSVSGTTSKTITITLNDTSTVQGSFTDENNYPTSLSFNSSSGDLTLARNGLSSLTANLTDNRYALKATTILPSGNGITGGGDLSANRTFSLDFNYLDDRYLGGYKQREAVRAATTADITLSGSQTIDGVTLVDGDRVLVKDQTDASENGIYIYNSGGTWTRATDFDEATPEEISQGSQVFVEEGTINGKTGWSLASPEPYTIGTTPLIFIQYAGANTYTAGTGLTLTGSQFSAQNTSAIWNASQLQGRTISSTTPTTNQILLYNGTNWAPTSTSIALSMPSIFSVSGSPITSLSGTLSASLTTQNANLVFAGPTSGGAAVPTFRALVSNDIPNLDASKITSGTLPVARGGTGLSSLGTGNQLIRVNSGGTALEYFTPTYLTGNQTITLSGDVTGSGATSISTTISNNAVTYAKMQDVTASRLLGRYSAANGDPQEISIGTGLTLDSATGVLSATTGSGSVTSVGLSLPSIFSVTNSPVTTSGTLTATLTTQGANLFLASPTSVSGTPSFRSIVNNDLPDSGVSVGTFNTITVNSKGIVTAASNTTYVLPNRALSILPGTGISISTPTTQDLSANRTWTITNTGVTTVNGNAGDVVIPIDGGIKTGSFTASGNGTSVFYDIPHGIAGTPSFISANAASLDARGISYIQALNNGITNVIRVYFDVARPIGTNNVIIKWSARL